MALASPHDPDDIIFEHTARSAKCFVAEVPAEFDFTAYERSPRDQGDRGTCAAFAGATIKEIQEKLDTAFGGRMSAEFIYYHRENKPASGMYGRDVFRVLQKIGTVPENDYPYREDELAPRPTDELYKKASKYRINAFARVTSIDGVRRALLELGPCYLQLPLYKARPSFWQGDPGERPNGGHAVVIIGYNVHGFILKNSWGPNWNDDGYILFPYEDWPVMMECWVSADSRNEFTPRTPLMSSPPAKKSKCCVLL